MAGNVVVDASVVSKWFLDDEKGTVQARDLLDEISAGKFIALAPALLIFEICSVMRRTVRQGRISREDAKDSVSDFFDLPIQTGIGNRFFYQDILETSLDYNLLSPDASYLALALKTGAILATSDKKLAAAAEKAGITTIRIGPESSNLES